MRPFQSIISEAPGTRSRRNSVAIAAILAGMILTLVPAAEAAPATPTTITAGIAFSNITGPTEGGFNISVSGRTHFIGLQNGDTINDAVTSINEAMLAFITAEGTPDALQYTVVARAGTGPDANKIALENEAGLPITIGANATYPATLAATGFVAGTTNNGIPASEDSPEGYRPFTAADGDTAKVAIAPANAKPGEDIVVIYCDAEIVQALTYIAGTRETAEGGTRVIGIPVTDPNVEAAAALAVAALEKAGIRLNP